MDRMSDVGVEIDAGTASISMMSFLATNFCRAGPLVAVRPPSDPDRNSVNTGPGPRLLPVSPSYSNTGSKPFCRG